jgi:hypothetical protein
MMLPTQTYSGTHSSTTELTASYPYDMRKLGSNPSTAISSSVPDVKEYRMGTPVITKISTNNIAKTTGIMTVNPSSIFPVKLGYIFFSLLTSLTIYTQE